MPSHASCHAVKISVFTAVVQDKAEVCGFLQMVHDEEELYSVQSMADLLFGNTDAVSCYASHRLLSQERMYFKQAGRNPPLFQARAPQDVHALKVKRDLEDKVGLAHSWCISQL